MLLMNELLLNRCRAGDDLAIEQMVNAHQPKIYRLALTILDDPDDARDVAQETFLAALRALDTFRGQSAFHTWLASIAINLCRTRLQRRKSRQRLQAILQALTFTRPETPGPEQTAIQTESDGALRAALNALDEKHRIPLILRYYHDYTVPEIAQMLQIPAGTVHSRLNTARARLAGTLGGPND